MRIQSVTPVRFGTGFRPEADAHAKALSDLLTALPDSGFPGPFPVLSGRNNNLHLVIPESQTEDNFKTWLLQNVAGVQKEQDGSLSYTVDKAKYRLDFEPAARLEVGIDPLLRSILKSGF